MRPYPRLPSTTSPTEAERTMNDAPRMIPQEPEMNETRPEAITLHALHDIHNELSPLLTDIEVLLDLCQDCEGDSSQARARASTLHTVLVVLVGQLRIQLDTLCNPYRGTREVQP